MSPATFSSRLLPPPPNASSSTPVRPKIYVPSPFPVPADPESLKDSTVNGVNLISSRRHSSPLVISISTLGADESKIHKRNGNCLKRCCVGVGMCLLITAVCLSLAACGWIHSEMNNIHLRQKAIGHHLIDLEQNLDKLSRENELLCTQVRDTKWKLEELELKEKERYEVKMLIAEGQRPTMPVRQTATEASSASKPSDFVIYVNGKPVSGREFMARGFNDIN